MADHEDRVVEIASRLCMSRIADPDFHLNADTLREAIVVATVMVDVGVPDDVLDTLAPRPGATDG